MRKSIKIFIATSGILLIILGLFCLCAPGAALVTMAWLLGLITLISGISELVATLNGQEYIPNSGTRVLSAVLQIIVGCILLGNTWLVTVSLPIIFAIWVMVEGIIIAVKSFDYKQVGYKAWWAILLLGICGAILGFSGLCKPVAAGKTLVILVGIGIISEGSSYLLALGGINRFEKRIKQGIANLRADNADEQ